jgi:uncharacterized repeat protein (TIGR01451 family)
VKWVILSGFALLLAGAVAVAASAERGSNLSGRVTGVVSGDTLDVQLTSGKHARVHVLGIVSPAAGACYAQEAAAATRQLTLGKQVSLTLSATRRGYSYVNLPDNSDLGRQLVDQGAAQLDIWGPAFSRFTAYLPAQQDAELSSRGMWSACAADVSVTLASAPAVAFVGQRIVYTATVTNAGPLGASDVSLDVRAPDGSVFDAAASDNGGSRCTVKGWYATCTFDRLDANATAGATFALTAVRTGAFSARALARINGCTRERCGNAPLHDANVENDRTGAFTSIRPAPPPGTVAAPPHQLPLDHWVDGGNCDPHYPTVCIPPLPPDLDCADLSFNRFRTVHDTPTTPDPHSLDNNFDGIGCQFDDY